MNELKDYRIRKNGDYTPNDVLTKSTEIVKNHDVKRMVVIIEDENGTVHRYNTAMDIVEMAGLLEFAKVSELVH